MTSAPALTFAELLRYHRAVSGLTQGELAEKAQLSVDAISTLERGARRKPRKETVMLLADALALSPDDRAVFIAAARRLPTPVMTASHEDAPSDEVVPVPTVEDLPHDVFIWPWMRARLIPVALSTLALLTVVGLLLPFVVPTFPRALGVVAGLGAFSVGALRVRQKRAQKSSQGFPRQQWQELRQPVVALASGALTLVVVLTTLFVTRPVVLSATHSTRGYDFSYVYHRPTQVGGSITIGVPVQLHSLATDWIGSGPWSFSNLFLWQTCLVQLPDQTLGLKGWQPDQCTEVPTVDNGGESADEMTTTFHIDPRAVWSDGVPITADDFLFGQRLAADPKLNTADFFRSMTLTKLNAHTVQIRWDKPEPDFLSTLGSLYPAPLHVYGVGKFAGIFNPVTGVYNSGLAQQLNETPFFNTMIPVDNGPFTVQSFVMDHQVVLVKNPRFFSNFFHTPALDKITLITVVQDFLPQFAAGLLPMPQMESDLINRYRQGTLDLAVSLEPFTLRQLGGIPKSQVQIASTSDTKELSFNQRPEAPNAKANGGVSIFTDRKVRQAFIEAFDRCAAVRALLGDVTCGDPNVFTDESDATAAVAAYDPTFKLPAYNPIDAAHLLDSAGYYVVNGVRRNKDRVTPLTLKLVVSPGASSSISIAQQMQQDFARNLRVGVTIEDNQIALSNQASPIQTGAFDLMMEDSQNSIDPILRLTHDKGTFDRDSIHHGNNPVGIIDPQANQRDQLAAKTPSDDQRKIILLNLHRDFSRQYYFEPVYITATIALKKPTLCNFKFWPDPWAFLWNMADWYVAPTCP